MAANKPTVFISYSHTDEQWKDRLVTHLSVLEGEGFLEVWEDRRIGAGDDWNDQIREGIEQANVAILLITADFLNSKFIRFQEVPPLLERRKQDGVTVIPIIVRHCTWQEVPWLASLQVRPADGRPLASGDDNQIDKDLTAIATEIHAILHPGETESDTPRWAVETTAKPQWNRRGIGWLAAAVASFALFATLSQLLLSDFPRLLAAIGLGAGIITMAAGALWRSGASGAWVKHLTHSVARSTPTRAAIVTFAAATLLGAGFLGFPRVEEIMGCRFPGTNCLIIGTFDQETLVPTLASRFARTAEILAQKFSILPTSLIDRIYRRDKLPDRCDDMCVDGAFTRGPNQFQLEARPIRAERRLTPIVLTDTTESAGVTLAFWHAITDSLISRFGLPVSETLRDSMRGVPTANEDALLQNNEGVRLTLQSEGPLSTDGGEHLLNDAIARFDRAIALDSNYAQAYANRAYARRLDDDASGAIADYQTAIAKLQRYAPFHRRLATVYASLGRNEEAIEQLSEATLLNPSYLLALADLAALYLRENQLSEAEVAALEALRADSTYAPALAFAGTIALRRKYFDSAVDYLIRAEDAWRNDEAHLRDHALVLLQLIRALEMLPDAERACGIIEIGQLNPLLTTLWPDSLLKYRQDLGCR